MESPAATDKTRPLLRLLFWLLPLECFRQPGFWRMVLPPLANMLILCVCIYSALPSHPGWTLLTELLMAPHYKSMNYRLLIAVPAMLLPLTLLLQLLERQGPKPFSYAFSWTAFLCSEALLLAAVLRSQPQADSVALLIAVSCCMASFFVFVPWGETFARLRRNLNAGLVTLVAAASPAVYIWFGSALWRATSAGTIWLSSVFIRLAGIDISVDYGQQFMRRFKMWDSYAIIFSSHFKLMIFTPCSGMEGIMLFLYVLSLFLLADWAFLTAALPILPLALAGVIFMLALNALRIAAIYVYAQWLGASGAGANTQQAMVELLHTNIGWVIDSAAIIAFLFFAYRYAAAQKRP